MEDKFKTYVNMHGDLVKVKVTSEPKVTLKTLIKIILVSLVLVLLSWFLMEFLARAMLV